MSEVGDLIKHVRASRGLSQNDVAKKVDCHPQFISNIERGIAGCPIRLARKICKILQIKEKDMIHAENKDYSIKLLRKWK